jgi:outer membrane lipoprotein SlyB
MGGRWWGAVVLVSLVSTGCTRMEKPLLYPNAYLQQVGKTQADADIEQCRKLASDYVPSSVGKDVAVSTGVGGAGGAAVGAVGGAVSGSGAGYGAAIGAASHATAPTPAYKSYVDTCLRERGYEVIGWQ